MTLQALTAAGYDADNAATKVIAKFGSNSRFARCLGKTHSTTARWLANGHIPGEYHADIVAAAKRESILLEPTDFVDLRLFEAAETPAG
jgi:hypothetical protein